MLIAAGVQPPVPEPWWEAGWVGNVITAVATISAVALTQTLASRRDRKSRWSDTKYEQYIRAISSVDRIAYDLKQLLEQAEATEVNNDEVGKNIKHLVDATAGLLDARSIFEILSPHDVHRAFDEMQTRFATILEAILKIQGRPDEVSSELTSRAFAEIMLLRDALIDLVRIDLEVPLQSRRNRKLRKELTMLNKKDGSN